VRDSSTVPRQPLSDTDLNKRAANISLTQMTIICTQLPHWHVTVENSAGITCRDVFEGIQKTFHVALTDAEREEHVPKKRRVKCDEEFKRRCKANPGLTEYNSKKGMMRVDLLEGKRIFMGLKRPQDGTEAHWVLEFGLPSDEQK